MTASRKIDAVFTVIKQLKKPKNYSSPAESHSAIVKLKDSLSTLCNVSKENPLDTVVDDSATMLDEEGYTSLMRIITTQDPVAVDAILYCKSMSKSLLEKQSRVGDPLTSHSAFTLAAAQVERNEEEKGDPKLFGATRKKAYSPCLIIFIMLLDRIGIHAGLDSGIMDEQDAPAKVQKINALTNALACLSKQLMMEKTANLFDHIKLDFIDAIAKGKMAVVQAYSKLLQQVGQFNFWNIMTVFAKNRSQINSYVADLRSGAIPKTDRFLRTCEFFYDNLYEFDLKTGFFSFADDKKVRESLYRMARSFENHKLMAFSILAGFLEEAPKSIESSSTLLKNYKPLLQQGREVSEFIEATAHRLKFDEKGKRSQKNQSFVENLLSHLQKFERITGNNLVIPLLVESMREAIADRKKYAQFQEDQQDKAKRVEARTSDHSKQYEFFHCYVKPSAVNVSKEKLLKLVEKDDRAVYGLALEWLASETPAHDHAPDALAAGISALRLP